jgi:hypothetical protein
VNRRGEKEERKKEKREEPKREPVHPIRHYRLAMLIEGQGDGGGDADSYGIRGSGKFSAKLPTRRWADGMTAAPRHPPHTHTKTTILLRVCISRSICLLVVIPNLD